MKRAKRKERNNAANTRAHWNEQKAGELNYM